MPDGSEHSLKDLVDLLSLHLLKAHADGKRIVLVVDEAQNLSVEVLEQVRLLTNLETETQKLLQIILIGQPELRELLGRVELRQLAQRITGRYHLDPLSGDEAAAYVRHRLRVAGATREVFSNGALARNSAALGWRAATHQHHQRSRLARRVHRRPPPGERQRRASRRGRSVRQEHPAALVAVGRGVGRRRAGRGERGAHPAATAGQPNPPRRWPPSPRRRRQRRRHLRPISTSC